jgi:hypothetical protein
MHKHGPHRKRKHYSGIHKSENGRGKKYSIRVGESEKSGKSEAHFIMEGKPASFARMFPGFIGLSFCQG